MLERDNTPKRTLTLGYVQELEGRIEQLEEDASRGRHLLERHSMLLNVLRDAGLNIPPECDDQQVAQAPRPLR